MISSPLSHSSKELGENASEDTTDNNITLWTKPIILSHRSTGTDWQPQYYTHHHLWLPPPRRLCFCQTLFVCVL